MERSFGLRSLETPAPDKKLTFGLRQLQHDTADVQVAFDAQRLLDLQIRDRYAQIPCVIADVNHFAQNLFLLLLHFMIR